MGQKCKLNFGAFLGENDLNSEKGGTYESPLDRYVPNPSSANACQDKKAASRDKRQRTTAGEKYVLVAALERSRFFSAEGSELEHSSMRCNGID